MMSSAFSLPGFFQQLLLALGEIHRRFHNHPAQQITSRATADRADALLRTEQFASLPGGILSFTRPSSVGTSSSPPSGVDDADGHFAVKIATVTGENGMLTNGDLYVKVSRRPSVYTHLTFAGQANTVASINTWRHLDGGFSLAHPTLAMTALHGFLMIWPEPAGRTGLLYGEEALLHPPAPCPDRCRGFRREPFSAPLPSQASHLCGRMLI